MMFLRLNKVMNAVAVAVVLGGLSASVLATLATGGSVTCLDTFAPERFAAALAAFP